AALALAHPELVPSALIPVGQAELGVRPGEKRPAGIPAFVRRDRDLEPLPDRDRARGGPGLGDLERVLRYELTHTHVIVVAHRQPPVRHDDPLGRAAQRDSHRFSWLDEHEARRFGSGRVAYPERQAVEYLVTDRWPPDVSQRVQPGVAEL